MKLFSIACAVRVRRRRIISLVVLGMVFFVCFQKKTTNVREFFVRPHGKPNSPKKKMSAKRNRDPSTDELEESARLTSFPRHLSANSVSDAPVTIKTSDDVPSLLNQIQQLGLQLLQEQQLRERFELERQDLEKQLQFEKNIRQHEQQLRQQEQKLREQEQQLREQQEQLLQMERQRSKQLDTELHDL